jgi:hypothetical protein
LLGVLDVRKNTQQWFNRSKRQRRGTQIGGSNGPVGGLNRHEPFDMGSQPDYTTTTELSMVSEGDKREGLSTQRMTGLKDGDGLVNICDL